MPFTNTLFVLFAKPGSGPVTGKDDGASAGGGFCGRRAPSTGTAMVPEEEEPDAAVSQEEDEAAASPKEPTQPRRKDMCQLKRKT